METTGVLIAWRELANSAVLLGRVSAGPGGYPEPSARPKSDPVLSPPGFEPLACSSLLSCSVSSPCGAGKGREARVPSCGPPSPASLGTAPLVVWGRLVCLCLKFPDSKFDVRAGLLVGGLVGRLFLHKCTRLAASQGSPDTGRRQTGEGWLVAKYLAWELRSLSPLLTPLSLVLSLAVPLSL